MPCVAAAEPGPHVITSYDGKAAVWVGAVDDLWRLGKPRGDGGPWIDAAVKAGEPSDPFLIWGFDHRSLYLRHDQREPLTVLVEIDLTGTWLWVPLESLTVPPGSTGSRYALPKDVQARWVRLTADRACGATAWFSLR